MEKRKQKEIAHYDKAVEGHRKEGDFEGFNPLFLESYRFLMDVLKEKGRGKVILDYGCGVGIHSLWLKSYAKELTGIDLSNNSLDIARRKVKKVKFFLMDCEKMKFKDNSFDVVFDGGTFSSLDLNKALPELARVLKPDGFLVGIETLGHNPVLNLKRRLNKIVGKRTEWAIEHIFRMEDLEKVKRYFCKVEVNFFHLISWVTFPFLGLPGGKFLLRLFEGMDKFLLKIFPFLRKYSFKAVFVFSQPKE